MTVLFRRDLTSREKIQSVAKLALEHASNLAAFASIYKVRCNLICNVRCVYSPPSGPKMF
jgi:hypothetical protein